MTWIEHRLAELAADGYFDDLPGSGQPIPDIDTQYEPTWWVSRWLERDAARQSSRPLRARLQRDVAAALELPHDQAGRRLQEIAAGVDELNRLLDSDQQLPAVDVDLVLIRRTWP